jgi:hypothetical protein
MMLVSYPKAYTKHTFGVLGNCCVSFKKDMSIVIALIF